MKKFLLRLFHFSLYGLIPLLLVAIIYIYYDPFKVLYHYDSFYDDSSSKARVTLNQDYVSTITFINNNPKIKYNSFIFGNSRSIFYQISDWKKHLKDNAVCYHFDASGETIWAIDKKVKYIDELGCDIQNILLILDYATLIQDKPKSDHLGIISPALVNNSNFFKFHRTFFSAFLSPKFFYAFMDYKISNKIKPYMVNEYLLDDRKRSYDKKTNELRFDYFEDLIKENKYYTPERLSKFYKRDTTTQKYYPKCIYDNQKLILEDIASITQKHKTNVKVIINPLYDQLKLNQDDLAYLNTLFGEDNVFDFSGINQFTNDYKNYYESSHYRPHIARKIMEMVYSE